MSAVALVKATILVALLGGTLLAVAAPRADAAENEIQGSSVLATWNCTSTPCPWGTADSGHAAVWPATAGHTRARYGYTVTHDVYADAATVAGWKVTVTAGNASVFAGAPNGSQGPQASLQTGQSHTIPTLSTGAVVSLQSDTAFQYTLTPSTAPTPTPTPTPTTPTATPTGTPTATPTGNSGSSVLATWNCTSTPCPWGTADSGHAAVWPATAGHTRARYGYTVTHDVYADAATVAGWKVTVTAGNASVFAGAPNGSQGPQASLQTGQSHTIPTLSTGAVVSLQSDTAFQYTLTPSTAPTPTPTPTPTTPTATPTGTPTATPTGNSGSSVLATWNCTSTPCPWGTADSGHAAVWPATAGHTRARYGYTVTHDVYADAATVAGWKVTVTAGNASVFAGAPNGSQGPQASLQTGQSHTIPTLSTGAVVSLQSDTAFQYTLTPSTAPTPTPTPTPTTPTACTDPTTCDPVSWVPGVWRYNGTDPTPSDNWIGGVITWPSWSAYSSNNREGLNSRTAYSESGEKLYPYMGAWADGCVIRVVSGGVLVIEWERGGDSWRETYLSAGDTYTIRLVGSEDNAVIETPNNSEPFTVSLSNCTPRQI